MKKYIVKVSNVEVKAIVREDETFSASELEAKIRAKMDQIGDATPDQIREFETKIEAYQFFTSAASRCETVYHTSNKTLVIGMVELETEEWNEDFEEWEESNEAYELFINEEVRRLA